MTRLNSQQRARLDPQGASVWDYIQSSYMTMMMDEEVIQAPSEGHDIAKELATDLSALTTLYNFMMSANPYKVISEWGYNPNTASDWLRLKTEDGKVDMGITVNGLQDPTSRLSRYGIDDGCYQMWTDNLYQLIRSFHLYCQRLSQGVKNPGTGISLSHTSGKFAPIM